MILNTQQADETVRENFTSLLDVTDIKYELEHHVPFVKDEETLIHEARQYDAVIRLAYSRGYSKRLLLFRSARLILLMPTYIHNSTFPLTMPNTSWQCVLSHDGSQISDILAVGLYYFVRRVISPVGSDSLRIYSDSKAFG